MELPKEHPLLYYGGQLVVMVMCLMLLLASYSLFLYVVPEDYSNFRMALLLQAPLFPYGGRPYSILGNTGIILVDAGLAVLLAALALRVLYRVFIFKERDRHSS